MDQNKVKSAKRLDLQGIRALAIIVVLGFHFFPEYCPNGYLGVDQFFVLSGFLMCMLLKRAENQSPCSLVSLFYFKRFKRILPLYLLFIFISMICLYYFFPDTAIETNKESAIRALLFVSNRAKTGQEDYFQMLSIAVDIFTHTWSLSVEVQFYILVPFIFLLATKIPVKFQYLFYGFLGLISVIFCYLSFPNVAFNNVFARIWQFLIGMIVYLIGISKPELTPETVYFEIDVDSECSEHHIVSEESEEYEIGSTEKLRRPSKFPQIAAHIVSFVLLFIVIFPLKLPALIVRPLVTIGTGFLMFISENNVVLSNRVLTYIGDISYSLYLIHWPIYAYWKLTCDGNIYFLLSALAISIILAVISFETFEKWYLKLTIIKTGVLVVVLILLNVLAIHKDETINLISTKGNSTDSEYVLDSMTVDDAIHLNYRWSVNDNKNMFSPSCVYESVNTPFGWCRHTGLSDSGKHKFVIIGNSFTANHAKMFYQECGYKAKSILQGAGLACEPLYPTKHAWCPEIFTEFEKRIESEKPDYAFTITRYISTGAPFAEKVTSFDNDPIYLEMKKQMLKFIPNIKHRLYILNQIPRVHVKEVPMIAPMIKKGIDPVVIDNMLIFPHEYKMARKRYAQLIRDCKGKCVLVDYVPEFYNNATKTFRYFDDRGFSYWTTSLHLSPHGIEHIRHVWTDICKKL